MLVGVLGGQDVALELAAPRGDVLDPPHGAVHLDARLGDGVVDERGERVGPNAEGTLYFRNKMGMGFEYHKDSEKTEAAHLEPGVFTTGDVGYLDDEGYLWLSDRKIDMIISGGVNIWIIDWNMNPTRNR